MEWISAPECSSMARPDELYLNDGTGHFTPVSWTNGAFLDEDGLKLSHAPLDWGLSAAFHDLNGDGWPDLYMSATIIGPPTGFG